MPETLKPCPLCGSEAIIEEPYNIASPQLWVECQGCKCLGPNRKTPQEAAAAWNQRPTPKAVEGQLSREQIESRFIWISRQLSSGQSTQDRIHELKVLALSALDAEEA